MYFNERKSITCTLFSCKKRQVDSYKKNKENIAQTVQVNKKWETNGTAVLHAISWIEWKVCHLVATIRKMIVAHFQMS